MIKGLYKLSRPISTLTGALAVLLGGYVAGTGTWVKITLAALSTILISAAANAWNDYQDIEIDKINQPKRPLPAGLVTPRAAWIFAAVVAFLSLVVAVFINTTAFMIAAASVLLLFIYSIYLKSTVLLGNITVATISALSAIFGGIAAGNPQPSLWLAAVIIVGIFGREVLKTLADYEGDLRQQCRTVATVWGRRAARVVFFVLIGATLVMMMAPYLADVYHPVYAYIVAIGVYPVVIYVMVRVTKERTGIQLEKLSQIMKYDFLVWFLAVLLGSTA
ncbi:MAG: UbiA family prenyltransferase [Chloroflexi bacterium]|nr:UbiA family prenyltransferase [Chloroflexota bacterium]